MNLDAHYSNIAQFSLEKIKNNQYEIDRLIKNLDDSRRGLTVLARPNEEVKSKLQYFISELRLIEPEQYYYPNSDIHTTILSIISCYPDFSLKSISIPDYIEIINNSIREIPPFSIQYKGAILSPSGIIIKGYPENNVLLELRNRLRQNFKSSHLEQSLDKRYTLQTAHSTIMRFSNPLKQKDKLIQLVKEFNDYDFGPFTVNKIEFVYNDWYQRAEHVKLLGKFAF